MAEFSEEYFIREKLDMKGDFSYLKEFEKLKEGETFFEICEGLGVYGITKKGGEAYLHKDLNGNLIKMDGI